MNAIITQDVYQYSKHFKFLTIIYELPLVLKNYYIVPVLGKLYMYMYVYMYIYICMYMYGLLFRKFVEGEGGRNVNLKGRNTLLS